MLTACLVKVLEMRVLKLLGEVAFVLAGITNNNILLVAAWPPRSVGCEPKWDGAAAVPSNVRLRARLCHRLSRQLTAAGPSYELNNHEQAEDHGGEAKLWDGHHTTSHVSC